MKKVLFAGLLMALVFGMTAHAADVSNTLTAGSWSSTSKLVGDVYQNSKLTRLTAAVSTTARVQVPVNAEGNVTVYATGESLNAGGVDLTAYLYPTPESFKVGTTTSYSDAVSYTITLGTVSNTTGNLVSLTLPKGMAGLAITGGSTISTSEVVNLRLQSNTAKECRWPRC